MRTIWRAMSTSLGRIHAGENPTAASSSATVNVGVSEWWGRARNASMSGQHLRPWAQWSRVTGTTTSSVSAVREERREAVCDADAAEIAQKHHPHVVIVTGR